MDTSKGIVSLACVCAAASASAHRAVRAVGPIGPLFNCWPAAQCRANAAKREGDKSAESRVPGLIGVAHRSIAVAASVAVILAPAVTLAPAAAMATGHGLDLDELVIGC